MDIRFRDPHELSVGKVYCGKITRISNSGNAIMNLPHGFINLGPGTRDEVGDIVVFEKREGSSGERVDDVDRDSIPHINEGIVDRKSKTEAEEGKKDRTSHSTTHLSLKTVGESFSGSANGLLSNYNNDA